MKQFLHIIIAGLFLISTSGFIVTEHYCGGNLVDVAINSAPESCCGDGSDCCSDVQSVHQFKSNFVIPTHEPIGEVQIALLDISCFEILNTEIIVDETEVIHNANDPPPLIEEIIYISQFSNLSPPLF